MEINYWDIGQQSIKKSEKKKTFIEDYCESSNALDAGGTQIWHHYLPK